MKSLLEESRLLSFLKIFRDGLWPGGKLKPPSAPRTADEKSRTRDEANRKLSSLVPGKPLFFKDIWIRNDLPRRFGRKHDR